MNIDCSTIVEQTMQQLGQLLALPIVHLQFTEQAGGSSGTVHKVLVWAQGDNEQPFILKRQDDDRAYRFYQLSR